MVFVCPDRANEDREARIEAVTEPHLRVADDPNNKHHIRGAEVVTWSADPLIYNRVMCSEWFVLLSLLVISTSINAFEHV